MTLEPEPSLNPDQLADALEFFYTLEDLISDTLKGRDDSDLDDCIDSIITSMAYHSGCLSAYRADLEYMEDFVFATFEDGYRHQQQRMKEDDL